jgi:ligand-binding sensor protein
VKPTDLQPVEVWETLELELHERSAMTAVVFDANNERVTATETWANRLCPLIKGNPDSASQVCAIAQQSMLAAALHTGAPIVDECDAGMVKIVVPIVVGNEVAGSVSVCGRVEGGGELERDYVAEATDADPGEIDRLASTVRTLSREEADDLARWMQGRVAELCKVSGTVPTET